MQNESSTSVALSPTPRTRSWIRGAMLCLIAILVVAAAPLAIGIGRAAIAAQHTHAALLRAAADMRAQDVEAGKADLAAADVSLEALGDALRSLRFLRDLPGSGPQIRALEDVVRAGRQTLDGVTDLFTVFQAVGIGLAPAQSYQKSLSKANLSQRLMRLGRTPLQPEADQPLAGAEKEGKRAVAQAFANSLRSLRLARDKIDLALELWRRVPERDLISPLRRELKPFADTLPVLKQTLDDAAPLVEIGLSFAGMSAGPHRSLVLLQNADELRPGGGFIGTVGTVTLDGGDLSEFDFFDVYRIDGAVASTWKDIPPEPIRDRLGVSKWFLRDANWSPDFPTSAERALDSYIREVELGTKMKLANPPKSVIALEPGLFSALLRFTGPVTVDGTTFDADTFFDRLEYVVESEFQQKGIPASRRKEILEKVGTALRDRLASIPVSRWPELVSLITTALERKQILLYSREPELLASLDRRGWTGRAHATEGDFLWVIDANMAAFKTDGVMAKRVTYALDATDATKPIATVTLTYTNTNPSFTWRYTRYRSYTRIYVPEGSRLLASSGALKDDRYRTGGVAVPGAVDVFQELGKTVFGAFWSIEPGTTGTLTFTYQLPTSTVSGLTHGRYLLDWPKQPGADRTQLTIDHAFGKKVQRAIPPEQKEKWGDARYEYKIDSLMDRKFEIRF